MAGKTWPPVPPPAMSNFIESFFVAAPYLARFVACSLRLAAGARGSLLGLRVLTDIEEHAGSQKHDQQT